MSDSTAPAPAGLQIQILTADHRARVVQPNKPGLTIGRKADNDIVLEDPRVADYHARLEQHDGHFRVIDLNSEAGTFLGETRLSPGVPAEWEPGTALRLGENWLQIREQAEQPAEPPAAEPPPTTNEPRFPIADDRLIQLSPTQTLGVSTGAAQLTVLPGKSAQTTIQIYNRGAQTEHYTLTVSGCPPAWIGQLPPVVTVAEGETQAVALTIQPPRLPSSRAGRYPITVQVAQQRAPQNQVEAKLALTVLAYSDFTANLHQRTLLSGDVTQLKIENLGNTPESFSVRVVEPEDLLRFEYADEAVTVPEGKTSIIPIRAEVRTRRWAGGARATPFTVEVKSASGQTQRTEAEVVSKAELPVWLAPVALLLSVCLCISVLYAFSNAFGPGFPFATRTPTGTITTLATPADRDGDGLSDADEARLGTNPALPDTDGDGLNDGAEIRAGANPLVVDSDGDTLSDGDEVLRRGTSPINTDTDGDGLPDNVDPDPGRWPTPTALPSVTPLPTWTPLPPTATLPATLVPPTATFVTPTHPATATNVPPTAVPPSPTVAPPTVTAPPPLELSGWIAFESNRAGNLELYLMPANSLAELRLTNNTADDTRLAWSPANNRLAFDSLRDGNSEIYVMNVDGSNQTRLTNNPARDTSPAWSPDGSRLAFLSDRDGNAEVYVMNADGSDARRVTNTAAGECCAAWSPAGNSLAFITPGVGLQRVNADGSNLTRLAPALPSSLSWSPDGARLAYVSDENGNNEIHAVNADGSGGARLTNNLAADTNPVYSPSGAQIAFISQRDGNPELYVMKPDGSGATRLTNHPGNICCVVWAPDGLHLTFASDREGNYEIYALNVSTNVLMRLTTNSAFDAPWAWRP